MAFKFFTSSIKKGSCSYINLVTLHNIIHAIGYFFFVLCIRSRTWLDNYFCIPKHDLIYLRYNLIPLNEQLLCMYNLKLGNVFNDFRKK